MILLEKNNTKNIGITVHVLTYHDKKRDQLTLNQHIFHFRDFKKIEKIWD